VGGLALKIGWDVVVGASAALAAGVIIIDVLTSRKKIGTLFHDLPRPDGGDARRPTPSRVLDLLVDIYDIPTGRGRHHRHHQSAHRDRPGLSRDQHGPSRPRTISGS
jgi:hypothetical protein